MSKERERVYMSYLRYLTSKQLQALEEWQYTRLSDPYTQSNARLRITGIELERVRRGYD